MSDDQKLVELCDELRLLAAHLTGDDFDRRPWAANRAAHVIEAQANTIAEIRAELGNIRSSEKFFQAMATKQHEQLTELRAEVDRLTAENERALRMRNSAVFAVQCFLKYEDPKAVMREWLTAAGFQHEPDHSLIAAPAPTVAPGEDDAH